MPSKKPYDVFFSANDLKTYDCVDRFVAAKIICVFSAQRLVAVFFHCFFSAQKLRNRMHLRQNSGTMCCVCMCVSGGVFGSLVRARYARYIFLSFHQLCICSQRPLTKYLWRIGHPKPAFMWWRLTLRTMQTRSSNNFSETMWCVSMQRTLCHLCRLPLLLYATTFGFVKEVPSTFFAVLSIFGEL